MRDRRSAGREAFSAPKVAPSSGIFKSSHLKLGRAQKHRVELEAVVRQFSQKNPYRLFVDEEPETGGKLLNLRPVEVLPSDNISLIVGDCINNLKAALDHAAYAGGRIAGLRIDPKRVKFPSGDNAQNFNSQCENLFKRGCTESDHWFLARMKSFDVYPGGSGRLLYLLTNLDNTSKHRSLVPMMRGVAHPSVEIFFPNGGTSSFMSNASIGFDEITIGFVPPGAKAKVHGHENIPVQVFFRGLWQLDMISVLKRMEREVLFHLHVLETFFEASPHLVLPDAD